MIVIRELMAAIRGEGYSGPAVGARIFLFRAPIFDGKSFWDAVEELDGLTTFNLRTAWLEDGCVLPSNRFFFDAAKKKLFYHVPSVNAVLDLATPIKKRTGSWEPRLRNGRVVCRLGHIKRMS